MSLSKGSGKLAMPFLPFHHVRTQHSRSHSATQDNILNRNQTCQCLHPWSSQTPELWENSFVLQIPSLWYFDKQKYYLNKMDDYIFTHEKLSRTDKLIMVYSYIQCSFGLKIIMFTRANTLLCKFFSECVLYIL